MLVVTQEIRAGSRIGHGRVLAPGGAYKVSACCILVRQSRLGGREFSQSIDFVSPRTTARDVDNCSSTFVALYVRSGARGDMPHRCSSQTLQPAQEKQNG